jgi:hypothetical protein
MKTKITELRQLTGNSSDIFLDASSNVGANI